MYARAIISGTVLNVAENMGWYRYLVDVNGNTVALNLKQLDRGPVVKENDKIYIVCGISTPQREKEDKTVSYIDFVVNDLCVESV